MNSEFANTASTAVAPAPIFLDDDWYGQPLPTNVDVGPKSWLHSSYVFLHFRSERPFALKVGHDTGIYVETFFDLGPDGEVIVGDYCTLAGPIVSTNGRVTIGNHVLISREVVISDCALARPPACNAAAQLATHLPADIEIGDNAWIGTRAVLLPGAKIGEGAIVGAATVVDFEVPPFAIVAGNPAKVVAWAPPATR
jgi:acetyltransferase-like isoleucine patch superfamily enzyme